MLNVQSDSLSWEVVLDKVTLVLVSCACGWSTVGVRIRWCEFLWCYILPLEDVDLAGERF